MNLKSKQERSNKQLNRTLLTSRRLAARYAYYVRIE